MNYTLTCKPTLVPYATFLSVFMMGFSFSNCITKEKCTKLIHCIVHYYSSTATLLSCTYQRKGYL